MEIGIALNMISRTSRNTGCHLELRIDAVSYIPFYEQIVLQVRSAIQCGTLKPGELFYSEGELAKKLGISKMPIRQAFRRLKAEGFLLTSKGRKPVIRAGSTPMDFQSLHGFTEEVRGGGHVPSAKLLEVIRIPADAEVAAKLKLDMEDPIYRLKRLRFIDGAPVALETTHLPAVLFPELETRALETESLYSIIERTYGRRLKMGEERLSAITAEAEEATLLGVEVGFPLLNAQRFVYDVYDVPVEFGYSLIRADQYYARIILHRGSLFQSKDEPDRLGKPLNGRTSGEG